MDPERRPGLRVILAHLSDLHLGFRAYGRIDRGVDIRERDVSVAFERALQDIIRLNPDIVVVSGDVFDRPDPPASAVVVLARGLELLRSSLPETPVFMVAGPRDTPRQLGDPGALAVLDSFPNVEAATDLTRSIIMERLELHACLVPYRATVRHPSAFPESDPRIRWNLLVLHGTLEQSEQAAVPVVPEDWSYIALGGQHRTEQVCSNVLWAGSLERVALDPWADAGGEKGFLMVNLESGEHQFHAIPSRPVAALAPIKVVGGDHDQLRRRVREVVQEIPGGIKGKIARLRLEGAFPQDLLALQGGELSGLRTSALHLAIEAGKEPRPFPADWLLEDAPSLLRVALEKELERDGFLDDATQAVIEELLDSDTADASKVHAVGGLDALDGDIPGVGRVSASIPVGLTAVIGGDGRSRKSIKELLIQIGGGSNNKPLRHFWACTDAGTLEEMLSIASLAIAFTRGLAVVDAALERLEPGDKSGTGLRSGTPALESNVPGSTSIDLEAIATETQSAEQDLRSLRAGVVEADVALEASMMDWLSERQDAETTLNTYRDRARQLRSRLRQLEATGPDAPCPLCGRVLEGHYDEVLRELNNEWEAVIQDGSWWRSRREQLELKPPNLQEREEKTLKLHMALEAQSERVELLRVRVSGMRVGGSLIEKEVAGDDHRGQVMLALLRVRAAREGRARDVLLDRASRFVCRLTGGRILAITLRGGGVRLEGDYETLRSISEEDLSAAKLAIRLAAASLIAAGGQGLGSLLLEEPFDRLDPEAGIRSLVLMKELASEVPRIILVSRGATVGARPELFDCIMEIREEGSTAGPALRPTPAGPGRFMLRSSAILKH